MDFFRGVGNSLVKTFARIKQLKKKKSDKFELDAQFQKTQMAHQNTDISTDAPNDPDKEKAT